MKAASPASDKQPYIKAASLLPDRQRDAAFSVSADLLQQKDQTGNAHKDIYHGAHGVGVQLSCNFAAYDRTQQDANGADSRKGQDLWMQKAIVDPSEKADRAGYAEE